MDLEALHAWVDAAWIDSEDNDSKSNQKLIKKKIKSKIKPSPSFRTYANVSSLSAFSRNHAPCSIYHPSKRTLTTSKSTHLLRTNPLHCRNRNTNNNAKHILMNLECKSHVIVSSSNAQPYPLSNIVL
eukprot:58890_1